MTGQGVYRHLRELREALDRPERLAWPEISHGLLLMMMSPTKQHQLVAHRLRLQLGPHLEADLVLMVETDMEDAAMGVLRVPDLVVIDEEEAVADGDAIDPRRAHLVIEIVARSNPANDYEGKLRDYPAMGIPHYLIIDPRDGSAVHYVAPPAVPVRSRTTIDSATFSVTRSPSPDGRSTRPGCLVTQRTAAGERHRAGLVRSWRSRRGSPGPGWRVPDRAAAIRSHRARGGRSSPGSIREMAAWTAGWTLPSPEAFTG